MTNQGMSIEAGNDAEIDSPLQPPEGKKPCPHLDFGPVKLKLDL